MKKLIIEYRLYIAEKLFSAILRVLPDEKESETLFTVIYLYFLNKDLLQSILDEKLEGAIEMINQ